MRSLAGMPPRTCGSAAERPLGGHTRVSYCVLRCAYGSVFWYGVRIRQDANSWPSGDTQRVVARCFCTEMRYLTDILRKSAKISWVFERTLTRGCLPKHQYYLPLRLTYWKPTPSCQDSAVIACSIFELHMLKITHAHFSSKDSFSISLTFPLSRRDTPRTEFCIQCSRTSTSGDATLNK